MADDIRWDILTIGHLSRNKFWGESDSRANRSPRCTCTLLRTGGRTIIVDPSCPPDEMATVLDERTGLKPDAIDSVFLTHFHGDHRYGIAAFPHAGWFMAREEIQDWEGCLPADSPDRTILARVRPIDGVLLPGIALIATPGHTRSHASLLFMSEGRRVVIAADAAMTRDFFHARDYYFNTEDPAQAVASIEQIAAIADIIVPGHDNLFLNPR
jgi:glyoxylase-like metal-dependent hydrolase (beta-lactamase superfamily II)